MLRTHGVFTIFTAKSLSRAGVVLICQLPKVLRTCQFLTILTSKSLSRAGVVQILSTSWATDPSQLPFFGPTFASFRSDKAMEKHSISRNSYPPKHLCCENIDAARATGNFQYSRKLELLNFLWLVYSSSRSSSSSSRSSSSSSSSSISSSRRSPRSSRSSVVGVIIVVAMVEMVVKALTPPPGHGPGGPYHWRGGTGKPGAGLIYIYISYIYRTY